MRHQGGSLCTARSPDLIVLLCRHSCRRAGMWVLPWRGGADTPRVTGPEPQVQITGPNHRPKNHRPKTRGRITGHSRASQGPRVDPQRVDCPPPGELPCSSRFPPSAARSVLPRNGRRASILPPRIGWP